MTALVSENTIDSRLVRSRWECTENQAVYCTIELCLSVDKLKKKKQQGRNDVGVQRSNVHVVYILSIVQTEITYTRARRHHASVVSIRTTQDSKPKLLRK